MRSALCSRSPNQTKSLSLRSSSEHVPLSATWLGHSSSATYGRPADDARLAFPFMSGNGRLFMSRLFALPPFAHHPDCACYDSHLLRVCGHPLCLGCTSMLAGAVLTALILLALWRAHMTPAGWPHALLFGTLGILLFLPTLLQPFRQIKIFKILSRMALGAAVIVLWTAGMLLLPLDPAGWLARLGFVLAFFVTLKATLRFRSRFTPDPSACCSPRRYPFCASNRSRVERLLAELRESASPGDQEFLAFADALVCSDMLEFTVDPASAKVAGDSDAARS
jgi:hypothetical protein